MIVKLSSLIRRMKEQYILIIILIATFILEISVLYLHYGHDFEKNIIIGWPWISTIFINIIVGSFISILSYKQGEKAQKYMIKADQAETEIINEMFQKMDSGIFFSKEAEEKFEEYNDDDLKRFISTLSSVDIANLLKNRKIMKINRSQYKARVGETFGVVFTKNKNAYLINNIEIRK